MPLFFVHVPKTAGTSFRLGAEEFFGAERIVYDYGKDSAVTAPAAHELLYQKRDFWAFRRQCESLKAAMVGGHVTASRFISLFGTDKTITFLRDPLQRMASEYGHFVRHYEYKGSFRDFYCRPVMHNRQSKFLQGVDLEALGFVGLTERYSESLAMINPNFGIEIPLRKDNQGQRSRRATHQFSAEEEGELKRLNKRDLTLYDRAAKLFDERNRLFREDKPWAHARLVEAGVQRVAGWAWWADGNDEPVEVEVWINDRLMGSTAAIDLRPNLCRLLPPRGGYVGFQLSVKLAPGDLVQCRISSTGQRFPLKPRPVPVPAES